MTLNNFSLTAYADEMWDNFKFEFLSKYSGQDYISVKDQYSIEASLLDFAHKIQNYLDSLGHYTIIEGIANGLVFIKSLPSAPYSEGPIYVILQRDRARTTNVGEDSIDFEITACPELVQAVLKFLDDKYVVEGAKAHWWFVASDGPTHISLRLKNKNKIYPEFYPWLGADPLKYFEDYLDSDAPLLFLSGPPGTGKTSFLRSMMCKLKLSTYVGYDIKLFENDEMFISFITSDHVALLVMEDAETLVLPRDKGGNNMMSRFLNVSDGLIKFPNKKIIFTTNESNFEQIDQALVRPGRCYDFVEFRKLTPDEAYAATVVAGLPPPRRDGKSHTIAELFNPQTRLREVARVGF